MTPPAIADDAAGAAGAPLVPAAPLVPDAPRPRSLYVHIPFCVSICPYCDFVVVAGAASRGPRNRIASFVAALRREIEMRSEPVAISSGSDAPRGHMNAGAKGRAIAPSRSDAPRGHMKRGVAEPGPQPGLQPGPQPGPQPGSGRSGEEPGASYYSEGHRAERGAARVELETLYFGGGTPSLLPADEIAGLIELVGERFGLADGAEITIEANPGPDERGDAAALRQAGVTRISFGAQALDDAALRSLGRRHRAADVGEAIAAARAAGIRSVNLDLLYDTPGQSVGGFAATLEAALALEPDHLSLYALTLDDPDAEGLTGAAGDHLPVARGARAWRMRARGAQDEDRAAAMYELAVELLAGAGFHGYEISNWARPGHESRHNLVYWERRPHEAVGPGAHAFDGLTRRWNAARLDTYVAALTPAGGAGGRLPPGGSEAIDDETAAAEAVILGLRLASGIPAAAAGRAPLAAHIEWALAEGLVQPVPGDRLALTTRGRLLSNELFSRLV